MAKHRSIRYWVHHRRRSRVLSHCQAAPSLERSGDYTPGHPTPFPCPSLHPGGGEGPLIPGSKVLLITLAVTSRRGARTNG